MPSTRDMMENFEEKGHPPLKVALISWNMANKYGGDIETLFSEITAKNENGTTHAPDIVLIAGQEEGRNPKQTLGTQIFGELNKKSQDYSQDEKWFDTKTKIHESGGRVSLTVISKKELGAKIDWVTPVQMGLPGFMNKGGIGCHITVKDHHFSVSGMHLDSNKDHLKVHAANAMIEKLEGFQSGAKDRNDIHYLSFDMMKKNSTDFDVMMGDLNHRHVKTNSQHYDPVSPEHFKESAARYFDALAFTPTQFTEEKSGQLAPNTYKKQKKGKELAKGRYAGDTGEPCYAEGTLDRFVTSISGETAKVNHAVVVETKLINNKPISDHKPIVTTIDIAKGAQSEFDRTREWVLRKIENYASQTVKDQLRELKADNETDQKHLEIVFNYYMNIRSLVLLAEEYRTTKNDVGYKALMGTHSTGLGQRETLETSLGLDRTLEALDNKNQPFQDKDGLIQKMIAQGNNLFKDKNYLTDDKALKNLEELKPKVEALGKDASKEKVRFNLMLNVIKNEHKNAHDNVESKQSSPTPTPPTSPKEGNAGIGKFKL